MTRKWFTAMAAGSLQAGFVLVPILLPMVVVWQRSVWPMQHGERFGIEKVPVLGKENHQQNILFILGTCYVVVAMVNNLLYVGVGYISLKPLPKDQEEQRAANRTKSMLWGLKSFVAWVFKFLLMFWVLVTLTVVIQFVLLLVVAMTVDPYRPIKILVLCLTVVGYAQVTIDSASEMRDRIKVSSYADHSEPAHWLNARFTRSLTDGTFLHRTCRRRSRSVTLLSTRISQRRRR
eukprot:COSAG01_NODE_533_length_15816_cov_4.518738_9_plen_234_part_00